MTDDCTGEAAIQIRGTGAHRLGALTGSLVCAF